MLTTLYRGELHRVGRLTGATQHLADIICRRFGHTYGTMADGPVVKLHYEGFSYIESHCGVSDVDFVECSHVEIYPNMTDMMSVDYILCYNQQDESEYVVLSIMIYIIPHLRSWIQNLQLFSHNYRTFYSTSKSLI